MNRRIFIYFLLLFAIFPVSGQLLLGGDSLALPISLPGGLTLLGGVTGGLTATFENVEGLTADNLNFSSQLISFLDALLTGRLPLGVTLPAGFPVLMRIEPVPASGLSFNGIGTVDVVTSSLQILQSSLRLYSAPLNGNFRDITTSVQRLQSASPGSSYRLQGAIGGFSEFLVVLDLTPVNQAIATKLGLLDQTLATNSGAMPEAVRATLAVQLATVRSHIAPGNETAALQDLDVFADMVKARSGTDIPDLWRSARDRVDVAGQLRATAATLQFSLRQRQGQ